MTEEERPKFKTGKYPHLAWIWIISNLIGLPAITLYLVGFFSGWWS